MAGIARSILSPLKNLMRKKSDGPIILMYHRVADLKTDPQLLSVGPERFDRQMKHLSECYRVVPLTEVADLARRGERANNCVAITFDDGYADNLISALPVLKKYNLPATVFVTSGHVGTDREFWWDDLERVLLLPDRLPAMLKFEVHGKTHEWAFGEGPHRPREEKWDVTSDTDPTGYHRAYRMMHGLLKSLDVAERERVMDALYRWAGLPAAGRPEYRALGLDEVRRLAADGLVDIGSHTVTHPMLSGMTTEAQAREMTESKAFLENILGRPVPTISYPFGSRHDISRATPGIAKKAGYRFACANFEGRVGPATNPYLLPRYIVRNWDAEEFSRRLRGWSNER